MPKRRSDLPAWLPEKGIIVRRDWYCYRPYLGCENGRSVYGREQRIVPVGATPGQFYRIFDKMIANNKPIRTLRWLLDEFHNSERMTKKSLSYQKKYWGMANTFCGITIKKRSGGKENLGSQPVKEFSRPKVQRIIDSAEKKVGMNRQIQHIKSAWNWALNRFEDMPENPFIGVELHEEKPRTRYIEDWEYWVTYICAAEMPVPVIAPAMELSYLCRARRGEVFSFMPSDLSDDGIFLARSKGSMDEITEWSPRLEHAIQFCARIYPDAPIPITKGRPIIHNKAGLAYNKNALDSAWKRVMEKAQNTGAELPPHLIEEARKMGGKVIGNRAFVTERFHFHDIKGKGVTDHEDENAGRHKSEKMEAVYTKKPKLMKATR